MFHCYPSFASPPILDPSSCHSQPLHSIESRFLRYALILDPETYLNNLKNIARIANADPVTPASMNIIIVVRNVISVSEITNIWDHSFRVFCQSQDPQLLAPCLRHNRGPPGMGCHLEDGKFFIQNIFSV